MEADAERAAVLSAMFERASDEFKRRNPHLFTTVSSGRRNPVTSAGPEQRMNKTESAFAERLEADRRAGKLLLWRFEGATLKIAEGARYTPDFVAWEPPAVLSFAPIWVFYEVKGPFIREAAKVRFKVAVERFGSVARFEMWQLTKRSGWTQIA